MKNITLDKLNNNVKCYYCKKNGFFCYTPEGADFYTCLICGKNAYDESVSYVYSCIYTYDQLDHFTSLIDLSLSEQTSDVLKKLSPGLLTELIKGKKYNILHDNLSNSNYHHYCENCKIVFEIGCTHGCNGCTSDVYNGHIVGKWKYGKEIYVGMPQFDCLNDYLDNISNIEILKWVCPNNGKISSCSASHYPKLKYPKYYSLCNLDSN
jgi:hypothetical protein